MENNETPELDKQFAPADELFQKIADENSRSITVFPLFLLTNNYFAPYGTQRMFAWCRALIVTAIRDAVTLTFATTRESKIGWRADTASAARWFAAAATDALDATYDIETESTPINENADTTESTQYVYEGLGAPQPGDEFLIGETWLPCLVEHGWPLSIYVREARIGVDFLIRAKVKTRRPRHDQNVVDALQGLVGLLQTTIARVGDHCEDIIRDKALDPDGPVVQGAYAILNIIDPTGERPFPL